MKFTVARTSSSYDQCPCDGAEKISEYDWGMDFGSMSDLLAFVQKHGDCVISNSPDANRPEIEIYDDWRLVT